MVGDIWRRRGVLIGAAAVAVAIVAAIVVWFVVGAGQGGQAGAAPTPAATESVEPTPTPSPTTPEGEFDENAEEYDLSALPAAEVHSVIPSLTVDDKPFDDTTGLVAEAASDAIPVFSHPRGEPVASLAAEQRFGGTTVPVVVEQTHWYKVLLAGRQGVAGEGNPAQVAGWVRAADVTVSENPHRVDVSLSDGTIRITTDDGGEPVSETLEGEFAWGTEATPTPEGRTFIMLNETVSFAYTRGHPMVYLAAQSPTLAGFGGQSVAVTAFHYHDAHSGPISNGCIRLGADDIARIAALPLGTPVYVHA